MMRIYVASKFENTVLVREAMSALVEDGHTITYDWTCHPDTQDPDRLLEEADADVAGIMACDALVLIYHPGMQGAWFEAGGAHFLGKPVIIISPDDTGMIFQHRANVAHVADLHSARAYLKLLSSSPGSSG